MASQSRMIGTWVRGGVASLAVGLATLGGSALGQPGPLPPQVVTYPPDAAGMAANQSARFAWELFVRVNRPAPPELQSSGGDHAVFQTWIDDPTLFPAEPDTANPPQWPRTFVESRPQIRSKVEASQGRFARFRAQARAAHGVERKNRPTATAEQDIIELVYHNYTGYKYIVDNKLWYQQGIAEAFAKAATLAQDTSRQSVNQPLQVISFPPDAIEVKSNWKLITEAQKKDYHWSVFPGQDGKSVVRGLVAMHISSKILPQWFWATFEHVDNPERSDYIGSLDDFGVRYPNPKNPAYQPPRASADDKYAPGEVTDALVKLYEEHGYRGGYLAAYRNYRLKGTQVDFTTSTGQPTLLGNSITESGFVPTSSCITCHGRAAADNQGRDAFPLAGFEPFLLPNAGSEAGASPNPNRSFRGPIDPSWFWQITTGFDPETGPDMKIYELKYLQTDFVWSIPFQANPTKTPTAPPK